MGKKIILNKRAQITLFVILGIIIVVAIIILAIVLSRLQKQQTDFINPKQYIETCIKEELPRPVDTIIDNGGFIEPKFSLMYNGTRYGYLCYTPNFWTRCNPVYPMLKSDIEKELQDYLDDKITGCFSRLKEWYEKQGYSVNIANPNLIIEIIPNKISAIARMRLEISKGSDVQVFDNFDTSVPSDLYDILSVATTIVSEEAKFCSFEYMGYTLANPKYRIRLIEYNDNHIYKIKITGSDREFKFATRGCIHWRGKVNA